MIAALLIAAVLIALAALALYTIRRVLYFRELHHLHKVTEWEARENCAPLSNAVINRTNIE